MMKHDQIITISTFSGPPDQESPGRQQVTLLITQSYKRIETFHHIVINIFWHVNMNDDEYY